MDNKKIFFKVLKEEFFPKLRDIGFRGSGRNFRRINEEIINTINIQLRRDGGSCTVNLGLHLTFLPLNWSEKLPDIKKIKEVDCEFRMRLAPKNESDYWWKYDSFIGRPSKKARHLIETYFKYGEPHFREFDTVDKIGAMVSIDDLKKSNFIEVFGGVTLQRGALAMARIQQHLGNFSKAKEYAHFGFEKLGRAVGLQSAFEEILKETK